MSPEVLILTAIVGALAIWGILRPAALFEYPTASAAVTCAYLIAQVWRIESSGDFDDYPLASVWNYMILCFIMTFVGFRVGALRKHKTPQNNLERFRGAYDIDKLLIGALALAAVGGFAVIMINRQLATMAVGEAWTGAIAFYALLSSLLWFATGLSWLIYLYTGRKLALALALFGFVMILIPIVFSARREPAFALAATILLGIFFVKHRTVSRLVLIPLLLVGFVLINRAGQIRSYIQTNNTPLVGALSDSKITQGPEQATAIGEVASAVSDITIAIYSDEYAFMVPYYNQLVNSYVPAFILGRDFKNSVLVDVSTDSTVESMRLSFGGTTRTGFSDSFTALHWFGCFVFFAIAYFMGSLWEKAKGGDIRAQIYYILFLPAGLKVMTESTTVFISVMPILFGSLGLVLLYARRKKVGAASAPTQRSERTGRPRGATSASPL